MAYFSSDFTPSGSMAEDDGAQHPGDDRYHQSAIGDPAPLDGPVSQPERCGLLRRIELRLGSVS